MVPGTVPDRLAQRAGSLEFSGRDGTEWRVSERNARHDPGARAEWCLVFSCEGAVRRVWGYPAGWRELSADALIALSWGR